MKYAILTVAARYPKIPRPIAMHSNIQDTLKEFTPTYYEGFEAKYSGMSITNDFVISQTLSTNKKPF